MPAMQAPEQTTGAMPCRVTPGHLPEDSLLCQNLVLGSLSCPHPQGKGMGGGRPWLAWVSV